MPQVKVRPYASSKVILLAMDWAAAGRADFLGFAIKRKPGFWVKGKGRETESWLPNRLSFKGPAPGGKDLPSDKNPIQKFMWWDGRIDDENVGKTITYTVYPVAGTQKKPVLVKADGRTISVKVPRPVQDGIGTWFNRAVVSSQAFSDRFGAKPKGKKLDDALSWLANGLEDVIPDFVNGAPEIDAAIYHLTDTRWAVPGLQAAKGGSLVYFWKDPTAKSEGDTSNEDAVNALAKLDSYPRTKTKIMHNKFVVRSSSGTPKSLLMGSANFSTGGLTGQANLLHTFESPALAALYKARADLLAGNPTTGVTAKGAAWSQPVNVHGTSVRAFFSPEPKEGRACIDTIVAAVKKAKSSVLFCLFTPTDGELLDALFEAGDRGKMMFGLVNSISAPNPDAANPERADVVAKTRIYHRSRKDQDVYSHGLYSKDVPGGFLREVPSVGEKQRFPVYIHHKFVVIDAETAAPTIFTGSANLSNSSNWSNDENVLEIKGNSALGDVYMAEFLRLYEHYRARTKWNAWLAGKYKTYQLADGASWAKDHLKPGTPEYKSRRAMVA